MEFLKLEPNEHIKETSRDCAIIGIPRGSESNVLNKIMKQAKRKGRIHLTNKRIIFETSFLMKKEFFSVYFKNIKNVEVARNIVSFKQKLSKNFGKRLGIKIAATMTGAAPVYAVANLVTLPVKVFALPFKAAKGVNKLVKGIGYIFITHEDQGNYEKIITGPIPKIKKYMEMVKTEMGTIHETAEIESSRN